MMKLPVTLDKKFVNQLFVIALYTLLVFNFLFAAWIYWGLPSVMYTPNGAEAGFVFLAIIVWVFVPILGIAFLYSPVKTDWFLPWLGALLLMWGAPVIPEPFDVFNRIAKEQILQIQFIEYVFALILAAWAVYRGIKAFKKIED